MTRLSGGRYLDEYVEWGVSAPTTDGKTLEFVVPLEDDPSTGLDDADLRYEYALSVRRSEGDLPVDALACRVWVPDDQGRVWTAESSSTTALLLPMFMASHPVITTDTERFDRAPPEVREAFEKSPLVEGAVFSDDSRIYERFTIGDEVANVIVKYSMLFFDIAATGETPEEAVPYVRLREGDRYDPDRSASDMRHTGELPALVARLDDPSWKILGSGGTVQNPSGDWLTHTFPRPPIFERTNETAPPQVCVRLVDRSWLMG
ncbi:MAG: hypothetical protein AAF594_12785 [Bacteroidota bacterium]